MTTSLRATCAAIFLLGYADRDESFQQRILNWPRVRCQIAATLLLGVMFPACLSAQGQERSPSVVEPFAKLQLELDLAADQQIIAQQRPRWPAPAIEMSLTTATDFNDAKRRSFSKRPQSPARIFQFLGVDAQSIFSDQGLPLGLLAVAGVESNFNPSALSPKGARGVWQLMPATARRYGLRVDAARDDRLDAEKSTRAAARYFGDLYAQFKDWPLALAAYNAGEEAVQKAIHRSGSADFWTLSYKKQLPDETRAYVPAVLNASQFLEKPFDSMDNGHLSTTRSSPSVLYATPFATRGIGSGFE